MLLVDFNIPELMTEQINLYLSNNKPEFSELKTLILSKAPVPQIHSKIADNLTKIKETNRLKMQKALESKAHKNQMIEDETQKKQDLSEEAKDNESQRCLSRELKQIPDQIFNHRTECKLLQHKLNQLMTAPPRIEVTQKSTSTSQQKSASRIEAHNRAIEKIRNSLLEHELKIQNLFQKQQKTQTQLEEIKSRSEVRKQQTHKRHQRLQATIAYKQTGEGIEATLSGKNRLSLVKSIQEQINALEKKCSDLIQDAEQINYPYFIDELQNYLASPKIKLTLSEIDALKAILKLMRQHLEYEHQAANTESSLKIKKQAISIQLTKLNAFNSKLKSLSEDNPNLNAANIKLTAKNQELEVSSANNIKIRDNLITPTMLLLALTFIFSIPLILAMSGIIPLSIAPAVFYSLVITPPAALLVATLGVGIAVLVYSIKAHMDDSAIKTNSQTIEINTSQMERNNQNQKNLETSSIPTLNAQINKEETARDNLALSLKSLRNLSSQAFKQAKNIEPVAFATSPVLTRKSKEQQKSPSYSEEDVQSVESESLEEPQSSEYSLY